ncbi:MAG: hydrogenase 4 subunit B [Rhizobiales bacterium]|nr:hydrogenase 4 subunit B [Hyphomicrobiales bacterium]MBI3674735.1 hydrogenase 4 subunit B [Hyphomicrobiales bacterium]
MSPEMATPLLAAIIGAIAIYGLAALLAGAIGGRALALVYPTAIAGAALAAGGDLAALVGQSDAMLQLPMGLPATGLHLRLDGLSAFFGLIVNVGVLAAAIYGLGLDREHGLNPRVEPFFALFAAAMNLVLIAADAFSFLFSWELMSLASWALVVARHDDADNRHAGHVYLVMAAMGTTALLFVFGGLAGIAGNYSFAAMREAHPSVTVVALVLTGTIVGAGSKAGLVPLHAWLPLAHPAAPSHVSALMSGVMTKVAIYGMIRIVFDLLGAPSWWWSLPFLLLGAASAVMGLLYAVLDRDLKRMLAYSTVENVGIISVGLGLALAFKSSGLDAAAAVATSAALLHSLNHSWFKSLLFLGAGAVLHGTGRRDFDGLGGLIHRLPVTAALWLVGVMSIAALPPFNGFVSEWLLFQAVLAGPQFPYPILRFLSPAVGAMLALAAALAAACFVRAYGTVFLGRPRSPAAAVAREANRPQLAAMGLLAVLCLFGGLFSVFTIALIQPLLVQYAGMPMASAGAGPTFFSLVAISAARSTYDAPIIALFLIVSGTVTTMAVHRLAARRTRRSAAWDCGFPDASPATQYTASSFAQPLRRVYGTAMFGSSERVDMPEPGDLRPARLDVRFVDYVWQGLHAAPAGMVLSLSEWLNRLQFLSIRRYLMLMFSALIVLLLIAAVWF